MESKARQQRVSYPGFLAVLIFLTGCSTAQLPQPDELFSIESDGSIQYHCQLLTEPECEVFRNAAQLSLVALLITDANGSQYFVIEDNQIRYRCQYLDPLACEIAKAAARRLITSAVTAAL